MPVTILSQPSSPNLTGTKLLYTVSGSDISLPQYNYVLDVYLSGSDEILSRQLQPPNSEGVGEFDPSAIFANYLSYDNLQKVSQQTTLPPSTTDGTPVNAAKIFNVKVGEAYSTSISSSLTIETGSTDNFIIVFQGNLNPAENNLLNDGYNFNTSSFGNNAPRSNLLTNYPTQNFGDGWTEDTQMFSINDYYTVTQLNNTLGVDPFPSIAGAVITGYLNLGDSRADVLIDSISPAGFPFYLDAPDLALYLQQYFYTWGLGPQNLMTTLDTVSGLPLWKEYIDSGSINEIDVNLPGTDNTRYFIRENIINNSVYQGDSALLIDSEKDDDQYRVPLNSEFIQFAFINDFGFFDYYTCFQPFKRNTGVDRENVSLPKVDYSSAVSTYDIESKGDKVYNTEFQDNYTITTDWLGKSISNWLSELFDSPSVFVRQGDDYVPIAVTSKNYITNESEARNKLFQYTIEFEPSNGRDLYSEEYDCLDGIPIVKFQHHFESNPIPSTVANRIRDNINLQRTSLGLYSKEWRIGADVQQLTITQPDTFEDAEGKFIYCPATITFEPQFRLFNVGGGGGQPNFDLPSFVEIEIKGDDDVLYFTSSTYPPNGQRTLDIDPIVIDFSGSYDCFTYSSSISSNAPTPTPTPTITVTPTVTPTITVSPTPTPTPSPLPIDPVGNPTWYYNSNEPGPSPNLFWRDTLGNGLDVNVTNDTSFIECDFVNPYYGDFYYDSGSDSNEMFRFGNLNSIIGSNAELTFTGWFNIENWDTTSGTAVRAEFITYGGITNTNNRVQFVTVGVQEVAGQNVLSIVADVTGTGAVVETFPSQVINLNTWYQITITRKGGRMNNHNVYVNNSTAFIPSDTTRIEMGTVTNVLAYTGRGIQSSATLNGYQTNFLFYENDEISQTQNSTNYNNLGNYLSLIHPCPTPTPTPTITPSASPSTIDFSYPEGFISGGLEHFYNAWDRINDSTTWYDTVTFGQSGSVSGSIDAGTRFENTTLENVPSASYYSDFTGSQVNVNDSIPPVVFNRPWDIVQTANSSSAYTIQTFSRQLAPNFLWTGIWTLGDNVAGDNLMLGAHFQTNVDTILYFTSIFGGQSTKYYGSEVLNVFGEPKNWNLTTMRVGSGSFTPNNNNIWVSINTGSFVQIADPNFQDVTIPSNTVNPNSVNWLGKSFWDQAGFPRGERTWSSGNAFMYHAIYNRTLTDEEVNQNYLAFISSSFPTI